MDDLLETLKALEFSEYEAKVYLALLQGPPGSAAPTGGEVSRRSSVPRSRVYDVLAMLCARGVAAPLQGDPVRYRPLPPAELVTRLRRAAQSRIDALETSLLALERPPTDGPVWHLEGAAVLDRARTLIAGARRLLLRGWGVDLTPLHADLAVAQARGCVIVAVVIGPPRPPVARVYVRDASGGGEGRALTLVADGRDALLASFGGRTARGAWLADPALAEALGESAAMTRCWRCWRVGCTATGGVWP
ncbi:MAG: hypothetical protein NTZ05_07725 [Chloroflexi bacterium]|nr:hypothetical protein [Chloroflexota bacterium]